MKTQTDTQDRRGYFRIHRALETREWAAVKTAVDEGANLEVLSPSGSTLEEFSRDLGVHNLFQQLRKYACGQQ